MKSGLKHVVGEIFSTEVYFVYSFKAKMVKTKQINTTFSLDLSKYIY